MEASYYSVHCIMHYIHVPCMYMCKCGFVSIWICSIFAIIFKVQGTIEPLTRYHFAML